MKSVFTGALMFAGLIVFFSPAVAQESDLLFSGLYAGGDVGANFTEGSDLGDGVDFGGFVGGRYQFGSGFVLGAEGRIGEIGGSQTTNGIVPDLGPSEITGSLGRNLSLQGIAGFAFGRNHVFGLAGYIDQKAKIVIVPEMGERISESGSEGDFLFGGGYERAITNRISLRATGKKTGDFFSANFGVIFRFGGTR